MHVCSDTRCVHTLLSGFCGTGNMRSALNDAAAAKKIKPNHLKALIRGACWGGDTTPLAMCCPRELKQLCVCDSAGAQCCIALRIYAEAIQWCDEGLEAHPADKKLLELRTAADKHRV